MMFRWFEMAIFVATVAIFAAPDRLLAEDQSPTDEGLIQMTFIMPMAENAPGSATNSAEFKKQMDNFFKKQFYPIEVIDSGMSVTTDYFTPDQIRLLEEAGFKAIPPLNVSLFDRAGCRARPKLVGPPQALPDVPQSVCRVVVPSSPGTGASVWILDSGVDSQAAALHMNVVLQVDCTQNNTCSAVAAADDIGHGTMIAGIVGGKPSATNGSFIGLTGVAPGASLKIVKIFGEDGEANLLDAPLRGLQYVALNAAPGDIVNLSWGLDWLASSKIRAYANGFELIDNILHMMADRQIRIVIAAGNAGDDKGDYPWVQSFFPANSATYESPVQNGNFPAGGIYSVSAAKTDNTEGTSVWSDKLWKRGAFGASFSEPGFKVRSYWLSDDSDVPRVQLNVCSGTSFAAPVLAGLFALGGPQNATSAPTAGPYSDTDELLFLIPGISDISEQWHPKCAS